MTDRYSLDIKEGVEVHELAPTACQLSTEFALATKMPPFVKTVDHLLMSMTNPGTVH